MGRRGENIFKRKDGRWEARILERRADGVKAYHSIYAKGYAEVKAKREEYIKNAPVFSAPSAKKLATFGYLADSWLFCIKGSVKESSYTRYHRNVYSYLLPALGRYAIFRMDKSIIEAFIENLKAHGGKRGNGLSEKTILDILSTLKSILNYATEQGYPAIRADTIRNPQAKHKKVNIIEESDALQIEAALLQSNDKISVGILLALHTGIRNGELCGLRWSDFDSQKGVLRISRTVERITDLDANTHSKTKVVVSEPKTSSSHREIPLPKTLCSYLLAHRDDNDTYILSGTKKPSEPHTLYVRYRRFLKRNGFAHYTFHALRHTFATRAVALGFDTKSLSEILGHSDVTTTLKYYVHPTMEQKRKQMENMFDSQIRGQKYGMQTPKSNGI